MNNNFEIRKKINVYFNGKKVIDDDFDNAYNYDDFVIAYNSNKLVIINPNGEVIFSKFGKVGSQPRCGKYIVMEDVNKQLGILKYDGSTFLPFEFYAIVVSFKDDIVSVKREKNSEWEDNYAKCT